MENIKLQRDILKLLGTSTISDDTKNNVRFFLSSMEDAKLKKLHKVLLKEKSKMKKLDDKKERITLKYKVMIEKLERSQK